MNKSLTPLGDFLQEYAEKNMHRFHIPGHNFLGFIPRSYDITEIKGAGRLFSYDEKLKDDPISKSEEIAAKIFDVKSTLFFTGGCTLAIQTLLFAAKKYGIKYIAASKNSHRSFKNACFLLGISVIWLDTIDIKNDKVSTSFDIETAKKIIKDTPDFAIFVTSINYYGEVFDIKSLRQAFPNTLILCDNAWGAYRIFKEHKNEFHFFCDLIAESAHKTLPALTGAAYLHISKNSPSFFTKEICKKASEVFSSTSPSYLILESLDFCNKFIVSKREQALSNFKDVSHLKCYFTDLGLELFPSDDTHITFLSRSFGYSGYDFANVLRSMGIEPEYSDENAVVLLFSPARTLNDFLLEKIFSCFQNIEKKPPLPKAYLSCSPFGAFE